MPARRRDDRTVMPWPSAALPRLSALIGGLPRNLPPVRRRRFAIRLAGLRLAGLTLLAALLALRVADPPPVEMLRLQIFDAYQRLWPRRAAPAGTVLVVRIDEASLAEVGQWPWPRTVVAELVDRLAGAGAAVVGLDILFAEPDRTSPPVVARQARGLPEATRASLAALPDHDEALAAAVARSPVVVAEASLASPAPDPGPDARPPALALIGPDPAPFLTRRPGRLRSLPALEAAARGIGSVDLSAEADGMARRIPLLTLAGGRIVPAFAVELVRVARGETTVVARTGPAGVDGLRVGGTLVRTDERGRVWVRYASRRAAPGRSVSARAVLAGEVPADRIAGRIVLVGATAAGLGDLRPTPQGGVTPGVQVHAELVETIVADAGLVRPAYALGVELLLILGCGLLVMGLVPRLGALATLALGGAVMAAVLLGSAALYGLADTLVDPSFAAGTGLLLWGTTAYLRFVREERVRRRTAGHLALLRQEGLLAARMQRAMLPRHLPAVPNLALHAEMHPAMDVGGDFYDAFELPAGRVGLVVADVSGKGMAAALFMAVARTVLRSTATADAGLCLGHANDLLAADNEAAMFVTTFYGVLDPASGVLDYANGGHNPPLVLTADGEVRPLEPTGGIPLGALEGVAYASRRTRLEPGDTLLLFTDGISEAFTADGRAYGDDRLRQRLAEARGLDPRRLVERVVADVRAFAAGAEPSDDLTCFAVGFGAPTAGGGA